MEKRIELIEMSLRKDSLCFLRRLMKSDDPFRALTTREIGHMVPTRHGNPRDRELVRKKMLRPLVDLGVLEKVTRQASGVVLPGHPISKSPHCAYRLTRVIGEKNDTFQKCVDTQCIFVDSSKHEQLMDACLEHLVRLHFPNVVNVYRDPSHGPRVNLKEMVALSAVGLEMDPLHDPCPDLVFWCEATDRLCIVEAVTTEGIIDDQRRRQLQEWVWKYNPGMEVMYVTAFCSWKVASAFMSKIGQHTRVWVQESPFQLWNVDKV